MKQIFFSSMLFIALLILTGCGGGGGGGNTKPPVISSFTKVIANWDVVPYQTISSQTNIGVVAFHETGVDVEFKVNGTVVSRESAPRQNPTTHSTDPAGTVHNDIWEYYITIDAANYADGPITISATAYPKDARYEERMLPDLVLYANSHGTLTNNTILYVSMTGNDITGNGSSATPYRTITKAYQMVGAGGTIRLMNGTYDLGMLTEVNYNYWTTITRDMNTAPNRSDVKIRGGENRARFTGNFVKYDGVQIFKDTPFQDDPSTAIYSLMLYIDSGYYVWFNDCEFLDQMGKDNQESFTLWAGTDPHYYMTNCYVHDVFGADGWWMRNCTIKNIGCDAWRPFNNNFYVNILIDNMDPAPGAHADLIQWYNPGQQADNIILYNITATRMSSQGIMSGDNSTAVNTAFVNVLMLAENDIGYSTSQIRQFDHLIMWHCTTNIIPLLIRDISLNKSFDIRNNIFYRFSLEGNVPVDSLEDSLIDYNHYYGLVDGQSSGVGSHATWGDPNYQGGANPSAGDPNGFHLLNTSPAYQRGVPLECVPADINGNLFNLTHPSLGAFETN